MSRCIVCGLDRSSGSSRAASVAAPLARDLACRALLIHVLSPGRFPYGRRLGRLGRARRWRKRLKAIAAEHCFPDGTAVRLKTGDAAEALMEVAQQEDAELMVVSSRDRASPGDAPVGSVASLLMRSASCPVVVVPLGCTAPLGSASLQAIVCGVAGNDKDIAVLRLAGDLARRLGAQLHAVHAYREGALPAAAQGPRRRVTDMLDRSRVDAHGIVLPLPVAEALQLVAKKERAGLIVIGSRDRGWRAEHGSASPVISDGDIPVVVLPPGRSPPQPRRGPGAPWLQARALGLAASP
jgi:nucleotide-binding universal stress UspA family protein